MNQILDIKLLQIQIYFYFFILGIFLVVPTLSYRYVIIKLQKKKIIKVINKEIRNKIQYSLIFLILGFYGFFVYFSFIEIQLFIRFLLKDMGN